jgi:tripartite ATP-independent transporter DctM subunit
MIQAGMARRIVDVFTALVGHFRGGLGISMVLAMGFFGALCGSILAAIVAIGTIMVPPMVKEGYPRPLVAALAASAGFLDVLIPPSNSAIIYCAITGENVARAFAAGIIPGFLFGGLLILLVLYKCRDMKASPWRGWRNVMQKLWSASAALLTPFIILGGIYAGIFTPTESAAVAGVWAILVGSIVYRELTWAGLWQALIRTAYSVAMIFAIIATASFLSVCLTYTRMPHKLVESVLSIGTGPVLFLYAVALIVLLLGTIIEVVPIMYLTLPIFAPIALGLNMDLLHLMVVFTAFIGLGLLTPPVCVGAYTAATVANEKSENVIREIFPFFFLVGIIYALILIYFPTLATFLPNMLV